MNIILLKKFNILFYGDNYLFDKLKKSKLNILKINNLENIKSNFNQILIKF